MTDVTGGIDGRIGLTLAPATHDFGNGAASRTFGINQSYLGLVLRVKQGQTLPVDEPTALTMSRRSTGMGFISPALWTAVRIKRSRRARPGRPMCRSFRLGL